MSLKDKITEEKNEYVLKGQLAQEEIQAKVSKFEGMVSDLEVELEAAREEGYQKRLEEQGQAGTDELIYSDKDMNEEVAKRTAVETELAALKASVEVMISDAVAVAVSSKEVALKAEFFNELTSVSLDDAALKQKYAPQSEVTV